MLRSPLSPWFRSLKKHSAPLLLGGHRLRCASGERALRGASRGNGKTTSHKNGDDWWFYHVLPDFLVVLLDFYHDSYDWEW
jgi:hypothetical protein